LNAGHGIVGLTNGRTKGDSNAGMVTLGKKSGGVPLSVQKGRQGEKSKKRRES